MVITTYNVQQIVIDYSKCLDLATYDSYSSIPTKYYLQHFKVSSDSGPKWVLQNTTVQLDGGNSYDTTQCRIQFNVPNNVKGPVYMYYKLTNFFQNHREYVESYDLPQIEGKAAKLADLSLKCTPLKTASDGKPIYPCGLIANSYFNDTFSNPVLLNPQGAGSTEKTFNMSTDDISWSADRRRFKKTKYSAADIAPPPNWAKRYPNGYTDENLPDISQDQLLQNWMRTAGLPVFMKLVAKNTVDSLEDGNYRIDINSNYPTSLYGGSKSVVLTTNSIIGGRNLSLGIGYLVGAAICVLFGIVFLMKQIIRPRKIGDNKYLDLAKDTGRGFRDVL